jgi:hypothetical protein
MIMHPPQPDRLLKSGEYEFCFKAEGSIAREL